MAAFSFLQWIQAKCRRATRWSPRRGQTLRTTGQRQAWPVRL